ncbi:oxidoreductase [Azospirillum endophyticum]
MEKLFLPINIGALDLAHRVVVPGMIDRRAIHRDGPAIDPRDCVRCVAPGGLVITPPIPVSSPPVSPGAAHPSVMACFDAPGSATAWAEAVGLVRERNAKLVARLCHAGDPPATVASLDAAAIDTVIEDFRRAAEQARRLGFDGVELDAADGSLPDQFLQDGANRRTDRYGGSVPNRLNFLGELIDALTGVWTAERVGVRLSPYGGFRGIADSDPATLFPAILTMLGEQELPFVHLVRTAADGAPLGHLPYQDRSFAARIRAAFPSAIIVSGAFTRERAVDLVRSRWADAIGVEAGIWKDETANR